MMQSYKLSTFLRLCHRFYVNNQDPRFMNSKLIQMLARNGCQLMENINTQTSQPTDLNPNNSRQIESCIQKLMSRSYSQRELGKSYTSYRQICKSQHSNLNFVKRFRKQLRRHYLKFHNQMLIQLYQQLKNKNNQSYQDIKEYLVSQLHVLIQKDSKHIYSYLQFLNFCTFCNIEEIQQYFDIKTFDDVDTFIRDIQYENKVLTTLSEFKACTIFNQYVEFSRIHIGSFNSFINYSVFSNVFLNIENRLQLIISWNSFIAIKCVSTGQFYVEHEITSEFYQQLTGDLYDVIVVGIDNIPEYFWQLKIRYINYYYNGDSEIQLSLGHPAELKTLSTNQVKINNLSDCIQLTNFYSSFNTYHEDDLSGLNQLKRIFSKHDKYIGGYKSLLEQIMVQNSNVIEYVNIRKGKSTVNSSEFGMDFPMLRYFHVEFTYMQNSNKVKFLVNQQDMSYLQFSYASNGVVQFGDNKSPMTLSQHYQLNRIQQRMSASDNDKNLLFLKQLQLYIQELNVETVTSQLYLGRIY